MILRGISKEFLQSNYSLCVASFLLNCAFLPLACAQSCGWQGDAAQVLSSGGPEL